MSLQANFAEWCRLRGLNPKPAVYIDDVGWLSREGDARIVRTVDRRKRAGNHAEQMYVIEQMVNDTISWPLGGVPMPKKRLLALLIQDTMKMRAGGF